MHFRLVTKHERCPSNRKQRSDFESSGCSLLFEGVAKAEKATSGERSIFSTKHEYNPTGTRPLAFTAPLHVVRKYQPYVYTAITILRNRGIY